MHPAISQIGLALLLFAAAAAAATQTGNDTNDHDDFLKQAFPDGIPAPQVVWLIGAVKVQATAALGRPPSALRQRYWLQGRRSAWVIDQIGKERPITFGIVVDNGHIEQLKVLRFRESRGGEIRFPFYTDQFRHARLTEQRRLDRHIDGISGATLSVRASRKVARLALALHHIVSDKASHATP